MLLKLIHLLIGKLSDEDKKALHAFLGTLIKSAAEGAVAGAVKK